MKTFLPSTRCGAVCGLLLSLLPLRAQFGPQQPVLIGDATVRQVVAADLDGDQDNDLVMGDAAGCYRLMNLDGAGAFSAPDTIAMIPTVVSHGVFGVVDMDGDGDVDLVLHDTETRELLLFPNDGTGAFAPPQLIALTPEYGFIQEVQCADITGSELPEVIIVYGATVRWFINEGGTFLTTDSLQHATGTECRNLLVGDLDMDGDPDHTVSALDGTIYVGLNDSDGTNWTSTLLPYTSGTLYYFGHTLIDVDADGDLDLVDGMNNVQWVENTVADSGNWDDYIEHPIATVSNEGAAWSEHMGCSEGASVFWCPWPYVTPVRWSYYDPVQGEMTAPVLLTGIPPVGDGRLYFGDLNGDGRKDLITFQEDTLAWFANNIGAVTTPPLDLLCAGDFPYHLPDGSPAGGTWSGEFVVENVFDAAFAPPGTYEIVYTTLDSTGCSASATAEIVVEICTGMRPQAGTQVMGIAPNPADDQVTITFAGTTLVDVDILDATGRLVAHRSQVSSSLHMQVGDLAPGAYHVRWHSPQGGTRTGVLVVR